ncbi:MAG: bifunctional adenosylcobinamide kinase/adenosylcobinamide-phosphate guanylyltransferase [Candidatus Limivivens sp.]|nr:bifunctional adenosylcobinamide kinase/adenosylcobinamide-phosphate guanylyltransferase [Candidatus Limivivens sp.]
MKLIIGGACQGKLAYACRLTGWEPEAFADGHSCEFEELDTCRGMYGFHEYLRRMLSEGRDLSGLAERIFKKNPDVVLISNEVGYGVVPVDAFERQYREVCGRVCCALTAKASEVHRVICGVGMVIKHE